jgi:cytochrome P450
MSSHFVHRDETIFPNPDDFLPDRWLNDKSRDLDRWLVAFSKGPRSCLGSNLAWAELYLCFAHVFRKFDLTVDPSSPKKLEWRDCFLPEYRGPHLKVVLTKVVA